MPEKKPAQAEGKGEGKTAGEGTKAQFGASPHTDFGAVTILLQDTTPGLEVLHNDQWIPVPPKEDALVVNVGDMLSLWTGGRYRSSVHRVVSKPGGGERFSVVFFLDGRLDCVLGDLGGRGKGEGDGGRKGGEVLTVEGHMLKRMGMSYGKGKKVGGEDAGKAGAV